MVWWFITTSSCRGRNVYPTCFRSMLNDAKIEKNKYVITNAYSCTQRCGHFHFWDGPNEFNFAHVQLCLFMLRSLCYITTCLYFASMTRSTIQLNFILCICRQCVSRTIGIWMYRHRGRKTNWHVGTSHQRTTANAFRLGSNETTRSTILDWRRCNEHKFGYTSNSGIVWWTNCNEIQR